jgi:NTP pyrophosphatase (non-canonical NTP hydrolase)
MNGHELARQLIAKHGVDRYPTPELAALKLTEEIGELAGAILKSARNSHGNLEDITKVRKEFADVGLTLYALGTMLGLDLLEEMQTVVDGETRKFKFSDVRFRDSQAIGSEQLVFPDWPK